MLGEIVSRVSGKTLADTISDLIWSKIGTERDALITTNEHGNPMSGGGMAATLRDVARFGLVYTKNPPPNQGRIISDALIKRIFDGQNAKPDNHGMLPQKYQWDMVSASGELAKGGWAGQLLYINRDKNVVGAYFGTNSFPIPNSNLYPAD